MEFYEDDVLTLQQNVLSKNCPRFPPRPRFVLTLQQNVLSKNTGGRVFIGI